jgi:hypothetical protein
LDARPFTEAELHHVAESHLGGADVGEWTCESIFAPVVSGTAGIWRVRGGPVSFVVKVVRHSADGHPNWLTGEDPSHWYYWKREALAYESGLLDSFSGGLRGPRLLASVHRDDGTIALWLEDLGSRSAAGWDAPRYRAAARDLGQAQGAFAAGRPLPEDRWLSRGWLRTYLTQRDTEMALLTDRDLWARRELRELFPDPPVEALQALRADQGRFVAALDRLPRTICHLDVHPRNLFSVDPAARSGSATATVLVDWAFVGHGALGEDAGNLVPDTVLDFHQPAGVLDDLHALVLEGYLAGLEAAGWRGDPASIRLALAAVVAAKYAWIVPAMLGAVHAGRETLNGRPLAEGLAHWAPVADYVLWAGDEARRLGDQIGMP